MAAIKDGLAGLVIGLVLHTISRIFAKFVKFMSCKTLYTYSCTVHEMCIYSLRYRSV